MKKDEILEKLELHKLWIEGKEGGKKADFSGEDLSDVDFTDCNLARAYFTGCNLTDAYFTDSNLAGAYFTGCNLSRANFTGCNLSRANFTGSNLEHADFTGAYFTGPYFSGAYFTNHCLADVDFTDCDLEHANLSGANFSGAYFSGANLSGAKLPLGVFSSKEEEMAEASRILAIIESGEGVLNMAEWHKGDDCHCIAGWCKPDLEYPAKQAAFLLPTLAKYFHEKENEKALAALRRVAKGEESVWDF